MPASARGQLLFKAVSPLNAARKVFVGLALVNVALTAYRMRRDRNDIEALIWDAITMACWLSIPFLARLRAAIRFYEKGIWLADGGHASAFGSFIPWEMWGSYQWEGNVLHLTGRPQPIVGGAVPGGTVRVSVRQKERLEHLLTRYIVTC